MSLLGNSVDKLVEQRGGWGCIAEGKVGDLNAMNLVELEWSCR